MAGESEGVVPQPLARHAWPISIESNVRITHGSDSDGRRSVAVFGILIDKSAYAVKLDFEHCRKETPVFLPHRARKRSRRLCLGTFRELRNIFRAMTIREIKTPVRRGEGRYSQ
jgi:hypothetical protein